MIRHGLLTLAALLFISLPVAAHDDVAQQAQSAPDFTLPKHPTGELTLSDYRGKVVLINFWASWCAPCRREMPLLESLYRTYGDKGFTLIGVNTDEDRAAANSVLEKTTLSFPIVFDTSLQVSSVYGVEAMPTTLLLNTKGEVVFVNRGFKSGDDEKYKAQIESLLAP
jgi:peroxiredoxin